MTERDTTEMQTAQALKNLPEGRPQAFTGVFMLHKATVRTARNGNEFLTVEAGDASGKFSFNAFADSPAFHICKEQEPGAILKLSGNTDHYQGKFSPKVQQCILVPEDEASSEGWMSKLIETCPENAEELWSELHTFIQDIPHPELRKTVEIVIDELGNTFKTSVAAISMHHAYRNGLLEHTLHMARACKALLPLYTDVDPSIAMAGIILHDTGKALEYTADRSTAKTRTGILQGHVVLGYRLARKAGMQAKLDLEVLERLEHVILSHQGELEWGAAVMAATPEAVFVSMIDNLDAKMGIVQRALRKTEEGQEFSEYSYALKSSILTTPLPY